MDLWPETLVASGDDKPVDWSLARFEMRPELEPFGQQRLEHQLPRSIRITRCGGSEDVPSVNDHPIGTANDLHIVRAVGSANHITEELIRDGHAATW